MSKKISAGDTLTVGDLTDDHLGAVIEVGPVRGITYRLQLDRIVHDGSTHVALVATGTGVRYAHRRYAVKVIAPPPVVQPDEPTELGQCIRIEGDDEWRAVVVESDDDGAPIRDTYGSWYDWDLILERAGDRRIIVSDPPRWPDETPVVPERIEVGEWPDDDTHLRAWVWVDSEGDPWGWHTVPGAVGGVGWARYHDGSRYRNPRMGPWTRGERVE